MGCLPHVKLRSSISTRFRLLSRLRGSGVNQRPTGRHDLPSRGALIFLSLSLSAFCSVGSLAATGRPATGLRGQRRHQINAPVYCCVIGRGAAVGKTFVEVDIAVTGRGDAAVVESVRLLVVDGAVAEFGGLLVGGGTVTCGVGWVVISWFVDGAPVVSSCWLQP
jgi:hypothetical protein